jgi:hypothetical protein
MKPANNPTNRNASILNYLSDLSIIRSLQPYLTYRPYQNNTLYSYNSLEFLYNDHNHTLLSQSDLQWKHFMNTCKYFISLKRQTIYMSLNSSSSKLFFENFSFRSHIITKILAYPSEQLEMKFRYLRKELDDDLEDESPPTKSALSTSFGNDEEQTGRDVGEEGKQLAKLSTLSLGSSGKSVFSSLHSLHLFYCSISSFSSFSAIKHLTVSYSNLPQVDSGSSHPSSTSTSTSVSSSTSSSLSLDYLHLSSLMSLVSIHFIKCDSLSDISHLKTATNLIKLQITKCRNICGIDQLTQLKSLSFNNGQLFNITTTLYSLTKLEELSVEDDQHLTPNLLFPFVKGVNVLHINEKSLSVISEKSSIRTKEKKLIIVNCSQFQDSNINELATSCISFLALHNCKNLPTGLSGFSHIRYLTLSILTHLENIDFLALLSLKDLTLLNCPSLKCLNIDGSSVRRVYIYLCINLTRISVLEGTSLRLLDINQQSPSIAFNNGMTSIPLLASDGNGAVDNNSSAFSFQPLQVYVNESFVVFNCHSSVAPNIYYQKGKTISFIKIETR